MFHYYYSAGRLQRESNDTQAISIPPWSRPDLTADAFSAAHSTAPLCASGIPASDFWVRYLTPTPSQTAHPLFPAGKTLLRSDLAPPSATAATQTGNWE